MALTYHDNQNLDWGEGGKKILTHMTKFVPCGISKLTTAHVRRVRRVRGVRRCAWCVLVCVVCAVCFQVDLLYNTLQLRLT